MPKPINQKKAIASRFSAELTDTKVYHGLELFDNGVKIGQMSFIPGPGYADFMRLLKIAGVSVTVSLTGKRSG